ncbi:MAG: hypothetical protein H0W64_11055 [Gammaproteobacteria bacterium]|nr:hypothetical protein [Gammaproteobacteria bacterium]
MLSGNIHKYMEHTYPENHWALDSTKEGTCVAFIKANDKYNYALKLNPTDKRGYRALVTYVGMDDADIQSTFNRQYTLREQKGLSSVTTLMVEIYKKLGLPIVQTAQAGNNAHSLDEFGITQIGNTKEPSMLHTHIWGRGNPKQEYIPGIPLEGPKPGEMFDMMAKTPTVPGNERKMPWDPKQLEKGLEIFKKTLHEYANSSEFRQEFGKALKVNIWKPGNLFEKANQLNFSRKDKFILGLSASVGLFALTNNLLSTSTSIASPFTPPKP